MSLSKGLLKGGYDTHSHQPKKITYQNKKKYFCSIEQFERIVICSICFSSMKGENSMIKN